MKLAIIGGRVYDPRNGIDGETRSIHVDGGRIVQADPATFAPDKTIDATGRAVLPGGIDLHCHIAGPSANRARRLRAGIESGWPVETVPAAALAPAVPATGALYALMGYTMAVDAAVAPSSARQCVLELADAPIIDKAFLVLLADCEAILELLDRGEDELAREVVAHLVARTGAFGIKSVNAGGIAHWKRWGEGGGPLDAPLRGRSTSPRRILDFLARACAELGLPHPLHIHASRLGMPGNIDVTLETSRALTGVRHHLTHAQFHAYGADGDRHTSAAARLAEHLDATPELSADVGEVMFGDALTLSADQELEHHLWRVTGKPYVDIDIELESGCGIVPIEYKCRSRLHSLQWSAGLELLLATRDPWRLALSTDHPNGASFAAYPLLIAQLMSSALRRETLALAHPSVAESSLLRDLSREYSLYEIAIVTRAGPARILGLESKGHLGPGADADITIYDDGPDREAMFRRPRWVIKSGEVVVEDGELRGTACGTLHRSAPAADRRAVEHYRAWHRDNASYDPGQLGPRDLDLAGSVISPSRRAP